MVGLGWEFEADGVLRVDEAAGEDDAHDAGAAGLLLATRCGWSPEVVLQTAAVRVDL